MGLSTAVRRFAATASVVGLGALSGLAGVGPSSAVAFAAGETQNYLIVYKSSNVPASAGATIARAGGQLVTTYSQIGVALARSSNANFRAAILADNSVDDASSTQGLGYQLPDGQAGADGGGSPGDLPNAPASDTDSLSPLQWDMRQIHTPEAHAITGGSPAVLVGDIDTGIDFNHPDLKPNIDVANSVNCVSGVPVPGLAAQDDNGHGTHTAGTIAAAANGFGIVGVAPNVRISAIKSGDAAGFFFPEAVVCGFVWAGTHHVDVTNNSYFADPFLFNCRNDAVQRAIWKAEQRAIKFAQSQGTLVVAAEGNESEDLSHPTVDATSPDDTTPIVRPVTNACVVIPVEISGVVGVSADGHNRQVDSNGNEIAGYQKSFYSSFGVSTVDVVAPGGDSVFGRNAEAVNGRVLSTYPANLPCLRSVTEAGPDEYPTVTYCYLQGTSMASPHVAGVAALIISRYGKSSNPQNGLMRPGAVEAQIQQTADPQPCPTAFTAPFGGNPAYEILGTGTQTGIFYPCQGGPGHNSWYGNGQVNALRAVTKSPGN